ncbi:alpha/beta fold hydrolase [Corynebacterium sp. HS2168-gen11]|uniref:alpha/beta fold hydrolase n=1 Tax=Corynebacterium sp. HS2168-gen11 TaxID=2974027 RepID=UPI00216B5DA1|nr:alpha/beta hydrolase [Corynebacterium sp. HS2168-gen11]MCS4535432.1 alpha/beta hydrolase [Corynebacterium sp. HS2168-gen11]
MIFELIAKRYREWRRLDNIREEEFRPPQFSLGRKVGGIRYYVEGPEDAPVTVVFVHGYTLAATVWHFQIAALSDTIRCVAMDLRGHGNSAVTPVEECTVDGAADDVMAVLDDADLRGPIIFVGHSLGGMVVLNFLRRYPQFRHNCAGVVLLATSARPFATEGVAKLLRTPVMEYLQSAAVENLPTTEAIRDTIEESVMPLLASAAFGFKTEPTTYNLHLQLMRETSIEAILGFLEDLSTHDETDALRALQGIPGRILVGDNDVMAPQEQAEFIAQHWSTASLQVLPGAAHMLQLEQPQTVTLSIKEIIGE